MCQKVIKCDQKSVRTLASNKNRFREGIRAKQIPRLVARRGVLGEGGSEESKKRRKDERKKGRNGDLKIWSKGNALQALTRLVGGLILS